MYDDWLTANNRGPVGLTVCSGEYWILLTPFPKTRRLSTEVAPNYLVLSTVAMVLDVQGKVNCKDCYGAKNEGDTARSLG